jgi:S1-C subfamily serine protease
MENLQINLQSRLSLASLKIICLAVIAVSQPATPSRGSDVDFDRTKSHTDEEWSAFYSFDDPNLTETQRRAAADVLRRGAAGQAEADVSHPSLIEVVARCKAAVMMLEVQTEDDRESGTGFFISSDGYLVTAAHVVSDALSADSLVATANDGTRYVAQRIAYCDKEADIAIVKFDCRSVPYLDPDTVEADEGQSILVIGSPKRLAGTISTGIVSAVREGAIQISAPISPGSSGSPVLNKDGRVIGVAVGFLEEGQNLNFAVPLTEIWRAMQAVSGLTARRRAIFDHYIAR